jgi:hypothetical protein
VEGIVTFKTVFDAANEGYAWWLPAFGLIFVALGGLLVFKPALAQRIMWWGLPLQGRYRTAFGWIYLVFGSFWTVGTFLGTYSPYYTAMSCLNAGNCPVVEGTVTNFIPMPYRGHKDESFTVNGRRFSYSEYDDVTPGFHNAASHGGPIHQGLYVRITYSGNMILRLEVAQ